MSTGLAFRHSDTDTRYVIRPFETADTDSFLALYSEVFGGDRTEAWLDWKYTSNPYTDRTPIIVAEQDGDLVGARPFFALRMRLGSDDFSVLQPADAMVDADHRGRGLFTRMTRAAMERHRDGGTAFYFNFPNPKSLPGNLKLGWDRVSELTTYYRIQDPGALVRSSGGRLVSLVAPLLTAASTAYLGVRERTVRTPEDITVHCHRSVPVSTLATLYREKVPDGLHATRDESFYRWRFGEAPSRYVTYVAEQQGEPRCALVVTGGRHDGARVRRIVDVAPVRPPGGDDGRRDALREALLAVIGDARDAAAVVAPGITLPAETMSSVGFHGRETPVLSHVTNASPFVARSLGEGKPPTQSVDGIDLLDPSNWAITFAEHDNR